MLRVKLLLKKTALYLVLLAFVSVNGQDVLNTTDSVPNIKKADSLESSVVPQKSPLTTDTQATNQLKTVVKIQRKNLIAGASVMDIDNDKKNEVILLSRHSVEIARLTNKTLQTFAEFKAPSGVAFINIDVADMNGNGAYELYISAVNATFELYQSMVLEYSNGQFTKLEKRCGYQFRVVNEPNGSRTLLGQKFSDGGVEKGDLFVMGLESNKLVEKKKVPIYDKAVHTFTSLCDNTDSSSVYAVTASDGLIEIIDKQSGSKVAESAGKFGGSPFAIKLPSHTLSNPAMSTLPIRNTSFDLNNDGVDELVCAKNHDTFLNLMASTRMYKQTHFEVLSFNKNEGTMESIWKSGVYGGLIIDFAVGDIDNDGKCNLVVIKLDNAGNTMFKKATTVIIVLH
jgi:hypothetical protein